jgi:DnaA-homolog protein
MKQLLLDIQPRVAPSIENFVIGRNAEAIHSLKQAIDGDSNVHFLYFWGESGSGKSHLLAAASELAKQHNLKLRCVDDVQLLDGHQQIQLFNDYNEARERHEMLIATGQASPSQMGLREDLATRLAWGLTYQLHPLNDLEKAQALKNYAHQKGFSLPEEVIDYCLTYLRRDLRTLMATLQALDEWSLTEKKRITVPLIKQLLQRPLLSENE